VKLLTKVSVNKMIPGSYPYDYQNLYKLVARSNTDSARRSGMNALAFWAVVVE